MPVPDTLADVDYVLVTSLYPSGWRRTAEQLQERVRRYRDAGLRGAVVHYSPDHRGVTQVRPDPAASTILTTPSQLSTVLEHVRVADVPVLLHAPTPGALAQVHALTPRLGLWMHELPPIDHRRLACDYTSAELGAMRRTLDAENAERRRAFQRVFSDGRVPIVFASEHQRRHAEYDVATPATNAHVIPQQMAAVPELTRVRTAEEVRSILLMITSDERHDGADIALRALEMLSAQRGFGDLSVTILGGGSEVGATPLTQLRNVYVTHGSPGPAERAAACFDHGVLLSPSRWNNHDPVLAQAMANGMVAITHPVGGTPEYVDASCARLPRPGDPHAFADAITELLEQPQVMPQLSRNAIQRVASQCNADETLGREIDIIGGLAT